MWSQSSSTNLDINQFVSTNFGQQQLTKLDALVQKLQKTDIDNLWQKLKKDPKFWTNYPLILNSSKINQNKIRILDVISNKFEKLWFSWEKVHQQANLKVLKQYIDNNITNNNLKGDEKQIREKINSIIGMIYSYWISVDIIQIGDYCEESLKQLQNVTNTLQILKILLIQQFEPLLKQPLKYTSQIQKNRSLIQKSSPKIIQTVFKVLESYNNIYDQPGIFVCLETITLLGPWVQSKQLFATKIPQTLIQFNQKLPSFKDAIYQTAIQINNCHAQLLKYKNYSQQQLQIVIQLIKSGLNGIKTVITVEDLIKNSNAILNSLQNNSFFLKKVVSVIKLLSAIFYIDRNMMKNMILKYSQIEKLLISGFNYLAAGLYVNHSSIKDVCIEIIVYVIQFKQLSGLLKPKLKELKDIIPNIMCHPQNIPINDEGMPIKKVKQSNNRNYQNLKIITYYLGTHYWLDFKQKLLASFQNIISASQLSVSALSKLVWTIGTLTDHFHNNQEVDLVAGFLEDLIKIQQQDLGQQTKNVVRTCIMHLIRQNAYLLKQCEQIIRGIYRMLLDIIYGKVYCCQQIINIAFDTIQALIQSLPHIFVESSNNEKILGQSFIQQVQNLSNKLQSSKVTKIYRIIGKLITVHPDQNIGIAWLETALGFHLAQFFCIVDGSSTNPRLYQQSAHQQKIELFLDYLMSIISSSKNIQNFIFCRTFKQILDCCQEIYSLFSGYLATKNKQILASKKFQKIKQKSIGVFLLILDKSSHMDEYLVKRLYVQIIDSLNKLALSYHKAHFRSKDQLTLLFFQRYIVFMKPALKIKNIAFLIDKLVVSSKPGFLKMSTSMQTSLLKFMKAIISKYQQIFHINKEIQRGFYEVLMESYKNNSIQQKQFEIQPLKTIILTINQDQDYKTDFYINYHQLFTNNILHLLFNRIIGIEQLNCILQVLFYYVCGLRNQEDFEPIANKTFKQSIANLVSNLSDLQITQFVQQLFDIEDYEDYVNKMKAFLQKCQKYTAFELMKARIQILQFQGDDQQEQEQRQ